MNALRHGLTSNDDSFCAMSFETEALSYASRRDPRWKRWMVRTIENLSGRRRFLPIYRTWRTRVAGRSPRPMCELLDMIGTRLDIAAPAWPIVPPPEQALVMVGNHPFGIGDGIALPHARIDAVANAHRAAARPEGVGRKVAMPSK